MYLQLVRPPVSANKATEGKMWLSGTFECFTLEDQDRELEKGGEKVYGETAIPRGRYDIDLTYSNRFKRICLY